MCTFKISYRTTDFSFLRGVGVGYWFIGMVCLLRCFILFDSSEPWLELLLVVWILFIIDWSCHLLLSWFQYWVSQGNKWCDFCKIYISNNPASIRNHELGQRHKDNVAKRLATMRKENAAKEKEQKEAARALEQIEAVRILLSFYVFNFLCLLY